MAEEDGKNGVDVDVTFAGSGLRLKNVKSINTFATVGTLMVVCAAAAYGYAVAATHVQETKEASDTLIKAIKEQTQVIREANCLQTYRGPESQRGPFCKDLSR